MNKYLILKFKGARLFRSLAPYDKNTDYTFPITIEKDPNGLYGKRCDLGMKSFREPITVYQISNLIHVLFNERPVPTFREVAYDKNEYYFDKAKKSYLKITSQKMTNGDYQKEFIRTKKAVHNSWDKFVQLNWEMIRRYVDSPIKLNNIQNELSQLLSTDCVKISFTKILSLVANLPKDDRLKLYQVIKNQGSIDGLIYAFGRYQNGKFEKQDLTKITNKKNKMVKMVNNGTGKFTSVSGEIAVPVSDEDIDKLEKFSSGGATILDSGLVWIDSIKYDSDISTDGFNLVGDISTEMIEYTKK